MLGQVIQEQVQVGGHNMNKENVIKRLKGLKQNKVCKVCKVKKSIEDFYLHSETRDHHFNTCKTCIKDIHKCKDCNNMIDKRSIRCSSCAKQGKFHPNYKDGRTNKKYYCRICGKKISRSNGISGNLRCSKCWGKYLSKHNTGINNPNFNNHKLKGKKNPILKILMSGKLNPMFGKKHTKKSKSLMSKIAGGTGIPYENSKYNGGLFNEQLKEFIRKRDNYTCQNCNMTEEKHNKLFNRSLHVHHIDYNKDNCNKDNLITVCLYCNNKANHNRSHWTQFYIEKLKCVI